MMRFTSRKFLLSLGAVFSCIGVIISSVAVGDLGAAGDALLALVGVVAAYNASEGASDFIARKGEVEMQKEKQLIDMTADSGTVDGYSEGTPEIVAGE